MKLVDSSDQSAVPLHLQRRDIAAQKAVPGDSAHVQEQRETAELGEYPVIAHLCDAIGEHTSYHRLVMFIGDSSSRVEVYFTAIFVWQTSVSRQIHS